MIKNKLDSKRTAANNFKYTFPVFYSTQFCEKVPCSPHSPQKKEKKNAALNTKARLLKHDTKTTEYVLTGSSKAQKIL